MGALIESLPISEDEYTISSGMLNDMLENKLEIAAEFYHWNISLAGTSASNHWTWNIISC